MDRHLLYGITVLPATRHKRTHPAITPANQTGTQFTYPGGMEGWVDLGSLIVAWPGIEPTSAWSHVRRSNCYTVYSYPENNRKAASSHQRMLTKRCKHTMAKQNIKTSTTRPQRKNASIQDQDKRSQERHLDSRFHVHLEEDEDGITRQRWMETSGLWPMLRAWIKSRPTWRQLLSESHDFLCRASPSVHFKYICH